MRTIAPLDEEPCSYARTGYASPNAVTQIANGVSTTTLVYDQNGNLTSSKLKGAAASSTYAYDYRNRITSAGNGTATSTYDYDDLGQRVRQTTGSVSTVYPFKY